MAIKRTKSQMPIDTGEWLDSPRINNLSYDLRGIWLTMLCYMWESPTRGIMAKANGKPYTQDQIIRLLDIDPLALSILLENGLLARNDKGAYYSPDMVHRERVSKSRRTAGRKGGEVMKDKILNPKIEETPPTIVEPPPTPAATPQKPALFKEDEVPETPPELSPEQKAKAEKKKKYKYAEFVTLTKDEYAKLCTEHTEEAVRRMIEILDNYKGQSGKRYKSDYRAILNWVVDRYNDEQLRYGIRPTTNATTAKSAGGFGTVAPYATGANPTATGASPQSGDAPEKGYSERF